MSKATRLPNCVTVAIVLALAPLAPAGPTSGAGRDDVKVPAFRSAKPVWLAGRETEMNLTVGFRAVFDAPAEKGAKVVLRVAAATIYRAWLNGEFLGCGPARGPHGYFRVDEWDLSPRLTAGKNLVAIEVAGYNCNSYYLLDQPSFCQAEVTTGDRVLASTAGDGMSFAAAPLAYRLQKVQRYSFQRPFIEVYRPNPGWDRWYCDAAARFAGEELLALAEEMQLPKTMTEPLRRRTDELIKTPRKPLDELEKDYQLAEKRLREARDQLETLIAQRQQLSKDIRARASQASGLRNQQAKHLLVRHVPYPEFALKVPVRLVGIGRVERRAKVENLWKDRSLVDVGPRLKGYPEKELQGVPSSEMQHLATVGVAPRDERWARPRLAESFFAIADLGANLTGFVGATITCPKLSRLVFTFDEILTKGDVDFKRLGCVNVVSYEFQPGTYQVESIEPYTMRYLKLICLEGECQVQDVYLREYAHPEPRAAKFHASDERLNRLFAAGVLTFRQNSLDIFMDCPSRERAGWLCDSFFTARVAADLTGGTPIEHNFLENYMLPEKFAHLPDGMLPMCYPADHYDGVYIPNWAMWFVVELEEYLGRSGDRATVDGLRPKVLRLLNFFKKYENSDGLLEKLPSWVFVEWSKANDFVQDVNYPSNMLYAGTLAAAGRIYGIPDLVAKAGKLRQTIRGQSFDGHFFVDNALRRTQGVPGKLQVTRNRSEVCQYFAFFFGVADRKTHAELWRVLRDEFGPNREKTKAHAEVHVANSFIGNMLRMELLSDAGRGQQILDESVAYLLYMAERTGTLWENVGAYASCNHGFASHICHTLYRDILGVRSVDPIAKRITLRFQDLKLEACEGTVPTRDGPVTLGWSVRHDQLQYRLTHPAGYQVTIENLNGKPLKRLGE